MKVFLSGGCKNGKSTLAETIAVRIADGRPLYYLATMIPHDEEDELRIERHKDARKDKGFITVECGDGLTKVLPSLDPDGVCLLDAVTALLANRYDAPEEVFMDLKAFSEQYPDVVYVSDYIYAAQEGYSEETEDYRRALAACDRYLAGICDVVIEVCGGLPFYFKGKEIGERLLSDKGEGR